MNTNAKHCLGSTRLHEGRDITGQKATSSQGRDGGASDLCRPCCACVVLNEFHPSMHHTCRSFSYYPLTHNRTLQYTYCTLDCNSLVPVRLLYQRHCTVQRLPVAVHSSYYSAHNLQPVFSPPCHSVPAVNAVTRHCRSDLTTGAKLVHAEILKARIN